MNTTLLRAVIIALTVIVTAITACASEQANIVIDSSTQIYHIYPDKSGKKAGKIKHKSQIVYRAEQTADKAVNMAYYNDRITIDKTTGGTTSYGSYFSGDVFYSDAKACLMTIPLKKAGATAKTTIERTFNDPDLFCTITLSEIYPSRNITVSFIVPSSLSDFRIEAANLDMSEVTCTVEEKGKERVITYFIPSLPAIKQVPRTPSLNVTTPQLRILGLYKDVNDLYKRLYDYSVRNVDQAPDSVAALARQITTHCATDSARIAEITSYVHQNIIYKAIEHGEYGYMPDSPSEVLRKKFGDCKGTAGLLRAMLRAVGIDGRYVWVGTEDIPTDWTEAPYLASGNHMIAAAFTGDSLLYIDGTARYLGIGDIPSPIQGRQTIIEDTPEQCIIDRIAPCSPDRNRTLTTLRLSILPDLSLSGTYDETWTGEYNAGMRTWIDRIAPDKQNDAFSAEIAGWKKGTKVKDVATVFHDRSMTLTGDITLNDACQSIDNELYIDINPYPALRHATLDIDKSCDLPRKLSILSISQWTTILEIPDGYNPVDIPEPTTFSSDNIDASLTTTASQEESIITRQLTITFKKRYIPASDIADYNNAIKELARNAALLVTLKKADNN